MPVLAYRYHRTTTPQQERVGIFYMHNGTKLSYKKRYLLHTNRTQSLVTAVVLGAHPVAARYRGKELCKIYGHVGPTWLLTFRWQHSRSVGRLNS
jgi:hypothetical protein